MTSGALVSEPPQSPACYTPLELNAEFRQGELLSGVLEHRFFSQTDEVSSLTHAYAFVVTQDCDLLRIQEARMGAGSAASILMLPAEPADIARKAISGSDIWKRIRSNTDERYQFVQAGRADTDLIGTAPPALVVDFRTLTSIPQDELYFQVASTTATRRSRLASGYREHLQNRLGSYLQRIALIQPHHHG